MSDSASRAKELQVLSKELIEKAKRLRKRKETLQDSRWKCGKEKGVWSLGVKVPTGIFLVVVASFSLI